MQPFSAWIFQYLSEDLLEGSPISFIYLINLAPICIQCKNLFITNYRTAPFCWTVISENIPIKAEYSDQFVHFLRNQAVKILFSTSYRK